MTRYFRGRSDDGAVGMSAVALAGEPQPADTARADRIRDRRRDRGVCRRTGGASSAQDSELGFREPGPSRGDATHAERPLLRCRPTRANAGRKVDAADRKERADRNQHP